MENYLERARTEGTPLIDGETVTFFWQGKHAPGLIGDFTDWDVPAITLQKAGTDVWIYPMKVPLDTYLEYTFVDPESKVRVPDPFNPRILPNGLGDKNHYFSMPQARFTDLIRRSRGVSRGTVTRHSVPTGYLASGNRRTLYLYRPPVSGPSPLLLVFDGPDYIRRGKIVQIVDNLIAQGRIRPIAMALLANGGSARVAEYTGESHLIFLRDFVLPMAREHLDLVDPASAIGAYSVAGMSVAGPMALFTCLRLPDLFSGALSQSGTFRLEGYTSVVADLVRCLPPRPLKVWLDTGIFESILGINRQMAALLAERGYQVKHHERPSGHNFTSWRNVLWRGLEYLFPPVGA